MEHSGNADETALARHARSRCPRTKDKRLIVEHNAPSLWYLLDLEHIADTLNDP